MRELHESVPGSRPANQGAAHTEGTEPGRELLPPAGSKRGGPERDCDEYPEYGKSDLGQSARDLGPYRVPGNTDPSRFRMQLVLATLVARFVSHALTLEPLPDGRRSDLPPRTDILWREVRSVSISSLRESPSGKRRSTWPDMRLTWRQFGDPRRPEIPAQKHLLRLFTTYSLVRL
jgi:hypothetical protein